MVLGFLKRGPVSVGCYGKLPLHGDYVSHASDGPEARALSAWLDEGYRQTPGRDNPDAAEVGFVFPARRSRRALVGVFWPSGDASGTRRFPFSLFVPTPPKSLGQYGALTPVGITPAIVNMTKAYPAIREAAAVDQIMHLVSGIPVPSFDDADSVRNRFGREASLAVSANGAKSVLFEVLHFVEALGGARKGEALGFAVRIPLRTEYAPSMESSAWLEILGRRLGDAGLASNSYLFVRPGRGAAEGEMFVIHRDLRPADLGFILIPSDEYPYGNILGGDADSPEAGEFVRTLDEKYPSGFTLADLVAAGTV